MLLYSSSHATSVNTLVSHRFDKKCGVHCCVMDGPNLSDYGFCSLQWPFSTDSLASGDIPCLENKVSSSRQFFLSDMWIS